MTHTATQNGDPDPAATMRAIYRYHAVDRGFGDIGYQHLLGEAGQVFEGRWSGTDGDPGHDSTGRGVTAAHVGGYNSGNLGMALLGTLTDRGPTAAARSSLERLIADLATRHGIDPQGSGTYVNPVDGTTWTGPEVPGHRDFAATECPGGALYAMLPTIRAGAAALMAGTAPTDTTALVISGVRAANVRATTAAIRWSTNEPATSRVEYWKAVSPGVVATASRTSLVTAHDVGLSGLSRRTQYRYRVRSSDAAGNAATSATFSFTTSR